MIVDGRSSARVGERPLRSDEMSYCRFSDDNWKSDVYIYESDHGYVCHVASMRYVDAIPPLLAWDKDNQAAYFERYTEQNAALRNAAKVRIGGPYDGAGETFDTIEELRDYVMELVAAGYHVPVFAIEAIEEEIAESK